MSLVDLVNNAWSDASGSLIDRASSCRKFSEQLLIDLGEAVKYCRGLTREVMVIESKGYYCDLMVVKSINKKEVTVQGDRAVFVLNGSNFHVSDRINVRYRKADETVLDYRLWPPNFRHKTVVGGHSYLRIIGWEKV